MTRSVILDMSDASFLDAIKHLKRELWDAMETKIAQAMPQVPQYYPQTHHNTPFFPPLAPRQMTMCLPHPPQFPPQFPPMFNQIRIR